MQDVTKCTLIPTRIFIELAIVCTKLQLVCLHLSLIRLHTIHVLSQCAAAAEIGDVGLGDAGPFLADENLESSQVSLLLHLPLRCFFLGCYTTFDSFDISLQPPLFL